MENLDNIIRRGWIDIPMYTSGSLVSWIPSQNVYPCTLQNRIPSRSIPFEQIPFGILRRSHPLYLMYHKLHTCEELEVALRPEVRLQLEESFERQNFQLNHQYHEMLCKIHVSWPNLYFNTILKSIRVNYSPFI